MTKHILILTIYNEEIIVILKIKKIYNLKMHIIIHSLTKFNYIIIKMHYYILNMYNVEEIKVAHSIFHY